MENLVTNKLKSYIGLAQRANAILYGEDIIKEKLRFAKVVLVSSDAGQKYIDRVRSKITECPLYLTDDLQGMLHRDGVKAVAITNQNLASAIIDLLR